MTDLDEMEKFRELRRNAKYCIAKVGKRTFELILLEGATLYSGVPILNGTIVIRGSWQKCFEMLLSMS